MKTKRRVLKKIGQLLCILLLAIVTQSCETDIPLIDDTPPEFSFRIFGDGFDHTFTQDTDFDNIILRLKRNTNYNFTYTGIDGGGVNYVIWSILPSRQLSVNARSIPAPWLSTSTNGNQYIRWNGDRDNPLTGAILSGSFTAPVGRNDVVFRFKVVDYGGETRTANSITKELNILTGNAVHVGIQNL